MHLLQLPSAYLRWHYVYAWADLLRIYTSISWFLATLFSLRILVSTLFSPWRRLSEHTGRGSTGLLGKLIINTLTRCFGFVVRTGTVLFGLVSLCVWTVLFSLCFIAWVALPLLAPALLVIGFGGMLALIT